MMGKAEVEGRGAISLRTQRFVEVVTLSSVHPSEKPVDTGYERVGSPVGKAFSHQKNRIVLRSQR